MGGFPEALLREEEIINELITRSLLRGYFISL
jgi:hypothetical protein